METSQQPVSVKYKKDAMQILSIFDEKKLSCQQAINNHVFL